MRLRDKLPKLQWLRNYAGLVRKDDDFAASGFMSRTDPTTKVIGYDKSAMVFHMLRRKIGEENFWSSLRDIYARYRFKAVTWTDLQEAFEERSGMALQSFFRQWIFKPGAPELAFSAIDLSAGDQGFEISGSVRQQAPYFDLPLELALETDQGVVTRRLHVSGAQSPFSFTSRGRPGKLTADPDVHLFRRLAPREVPPTVNSVRGAASVNVVVSNDLDPSAMKIARRLSAAMGLSRVRIGREADFTAGELRGRDLLFFGNPSRKEGLPDGLFHFAITPEGFILNGETYEGDRSSFFGVFRHPTEKTRSAAVFIPASLELAKALSTKIPHYGKYSYLVFNDTRNQVKGTWAAVNSPLSVQWPADAKTDRRRK